MGDGILDASVPRRGEMMKPQDEGRAAWIARQKAAVDRTLDALEADPPHRAIDIGSITIACALGYLDFRFAAQPWRPGCQACRLVRGVRAQPRDRRYGAEGSRLIDLRDAPLRRRR